MPLVAFEGIDGSGKTTLSNRVVEVLRGRGLRVCHARENGQLASPVAARIRELCRDPRNLALSDTAELLLYAAREAQTLEEIVRPALARGDLVIADRSLASHHVLATCGRGLPEHAVRPVLDFAAGGTETDLVVLVDVDPHLARARRRCRKAEFGRPPSRKGAAGPALQWRVREGLLRLARCEPRRWAVFDNTEADLGALVEAIAARIMELVQPQPGSAKIAPPTPLRPRGWPPRDLARRPDRGEALCSAFFGWVEWRARAEPAVALHFLTGLGGPRAARLQEEVAARAPEEAARSLAGLWDPPSRSLRRALAPAHPGPVAESLAGSGEIEEAMELREALAERAPGAVAASLRGCAGPRAMALRQALARVAPGEVLESLEGMDDAASWDLRARLGSAPHLAGALAAGLGGLGSERAWKARWAVREVAPLEVLRSLDRLDDDRAWELRENWAARAPRTVLLSVRGMDHPLAWALRRRLAPVAKEALDSVMGMDLAAAWELREAWLPAYPSTAVHSLGPLAGTPRGEELLWSAVELWPDNVSLLRHAVQVLMTTSERPTGLEVA